MLIASDPRAFPLAPIRPEKGTMAMLLVVSILTVIATTVLELENASTMHKPIEPSALVRSTILPVLLTVALHLASTEFSDVGAIWPNQFASAITQVFPVLTLVTLRALSIRIIATAMALTIEPLPEVDSPIACTELAHPVAFAIEPVTLVDVAIGVDKTSFATGYTFRPVALVDGTVGPNLSAPALPSLTAGNPLALIGQLASLFVARVTTNVKLYKRSCLQ